MHRLVSGARGGEEHGFAPDFMAPKKDITVGDIRAKPGETAEGYVEVGEGQDTLPIRLPIAIINGEGEGPIVYIQAASDGDELNGIEVTRRILRHVKPARLRGGLIAAPIVNPPGFYAHTGHNPIDGLKLNRCFPGRPDGALSERIAHFLFHQAVLQSQFCIDLHQGGTGRMIDECRVRVAKSERGGRASLELARVFGIGYILHEKGPNGQLARAAPARGIPTIDPELGGCRGWDESSIRKGVKGVMNVLRHYGLLPGEAQIPKRQVIVRRLHKVFSPRGGFIAYKRPLYDLVEKGDVLAEISDPFGNPVASVPSPVSGVFWSQNVYPMVSTGQTIGQIGADVAFID